MDLNQIFARVDELKAQIDALRPIKPEQEQRILQKFRLDWNYHSNAIEGNSLTLGETRAFLLEGLTAKGKPLKDHLDIRGHNKLITFLEGFVQQKEILTEAAIREMHKILLVEPYQVEARTPDGRVTKKWVKLGEYKAEPNAVQTATGEWIYYARPEDTPARMAELVGWYRQQAEKRAEHPLLVATLFHHRFTTIHPFDDGNGRMARALMNLILMREGFSPVVIKDKFRKEYVAALRKADAGESGDLLFFIGEELVWSLELFIRGARGEDIQGSDDLEKEIALLKQEILSKAKSKESQFDFENHRFTTLIQPLISLICGKLASFEGLFHATQIGVEIESDEWSISTGSDNCVHVSDSVANLWEQTHKHGRIVRKIHIGIEWSNLKGDEVSGKPYSLGVVFDLNCEPHTLLLVFGSPDNKHMEYPKEAFFNPKPIEQVTEEIRKRLVSEVKNRIGN